MKYHYAIFFLAVPLLGMSQGTTEWLDINGARVRFYSNGHIGNSGNDDFQLGYFVPATSSISPLSNAGLWIGGIDGNGELRVAAHFYGLGQDFYPGPLTIDGSAAITTEVTQAYDRIWKVNRNDVILHHQYHQCVQDPNCDPSVQFPGYQAPEPFMTWPAHGDVSLGQSLYLAPFFDLNNDGIYDPVSGDHPCVPGDQALYMIFNDNTAPHTESLGLPIGLEVHMMPFAYTGAESALEQTIFIHYKLINRSAQTLHDVFVGTFVDGNIGCSNDDFVGSDVGRNMIFFYNWDDVDLSCGAYFLGYGSTPPAFGVATLKGPKVDANGVDDQIDLALPSYNGIGFTDGTIDNERHGLSRMIYFNREGNLVMTDPTAPPHFYNYLQGKWKNGVQMAYGGNGYNDGPSAVPAFFMFPGDTDTLGVGTNGIPMPPWQETQPTPTQPDRRGLASMGPFTLEAGEEDDILIAYVFAHAGTGGALASVEALKARVDSVRAFAETIPGIMAPGSPCEGIFTGIADRASPKPLMLYPNPSTGWLTVEASGPSVITIFDSRGALVHQELLTNGRNVIGIEDLSTGLFHVVCRDRNGTRHGRFMKQ